MMSGGKAAALAAAGVLNERASRVTDPVFCSSSFFDARDVVQVKYEMVRRVRVDNVSVTASVKAFGFGRSAYYAAQKALDVGGPAALAPGKPGPKGPRKLTAPVMDQVAAWLGEDPRRSARQAVAMVADRFAISVHPRSIERALARRREAADREPA